MGYVTKNKIPKNGDVPGTHRIDVSGVGMFYYVHFFMDFSWQHVGKYAIWDVFFNDHVRFYTKPV